MNPLSLAWWRSLIQPVKQEEPKRRRRGLRESNYNIDFNLGGYTDLLNRFTDGGVYAYPITNPKDRLYGSNYPFWYSEQQLNLIRAQARLLTTTNPNAQGLLNGLCSYVIGSGFGYRVMPKEGRDVSDDVIQQITDVVRRFIDDNEWDLMEQEIFIRSREDGECFLRYFPQPSGRLLVRTIEPEQIYQPPGSTFLDWSYGIQCEKDDIFSIIAYNVDYDAPLGFETPDQKNDRIGEIVPASEVVHIKCNVKKSIKRGLSDFSYETLETFITAGKLRKNLGEGSSVQSAIAAIRQHETSTKDQVEDFIDENIDYSAYTGIPLRETNFQRIEPGTFLDIPKGMEYVQPPGSENAESHLKILQSLLRSAGNRHNAPEWLSSADVSGANYASSLTAESPFLKNCNRLQSVYKRHFGRIIREAIITAAEAGELPIDVIDLVDVIVTAPTVEARDRIAESSSNQAYVGMGIKSRQTIAQELGLDWEQEKRNIENDQDQEESLDGGDLQMGGDAAQVSDQALNGLQIENFVGIVTRVAAGQLTTEVGKAIAAAAFPLMSSDQINAIFPDSLYKSAMHTTPTKQPSDNPSLPQEPDLPLEPSIPEQVSESIEAEGGKYSHISFKPPESAKKAAKRGLELRRKLGRGGTAVGIARARDIANGKEMSPSTVKRMFSFFSRHEVDKKGKGWGKDSNGYVAWLLWGGDAGFSWARKVRNQMDAADKKGSKKKSVNELQYGRPKKDDPRKTPAKPHEKRKGSKRNPKGSASKANKGIEVSVDTQKKIKELMKKHNEKNPDFKASMATLKSVFRRGAGAFSTSHAPGMDRTRWGLKRIEAFLYLLRNGRPSNPNYKQDNDLLPSEHERSSKGES